MTEKKSHQGTYVVVSIGADQDGAGLAEIGRFDAASAPEALKIACGTNGLIGKFKVVPLRNWKTYNAIPTTALKVEVEE